MNQSKRFWKCLIVWCTSLSGRWKEDAKGVKMHHSVSKRPILQFVSIKRKDCGEWAIPGVRSFHILYISFSNFIAVVCCFSLYITATLFHSALLFIVPMQLYTGGFEYLWVCKMFLWLACLCACFVGDGRSRGAGLSHTATGVLGRGFKLAGRPAVREGKNPWTHHKAFQITRLSG